MNHSTTARGRAPATSTPRLRSAPRWRVKHVSSSNSRVPAVPGLYAIGHDEFFLGLEADRTYVYIGRTRNLRRRIAEHVPAIEENPGLRKYLRQRYSSAKCWYAQFQETELNQAESKLIRRFQPIYNTQGKIMPDIGESNDD